MATKAISYLRRAGAAAAASAAGLELADAGGYFQATSVEGALQEIGAALQGGGGGGLAGVHQAAFNGVTQNQIVTVNHAAEPFGARLVQVLELQPDEEVSNTSLDFDLADEPQFIQEDAVAGTEFAGGVVRLRSSSVVSCVTGLDSETKLGAASFDGFSITVPLGGSQDASSGAVRTIQSLPVSGKWYWEHKISGVDYFFSGLVKPAHYDGRNPGQQWVGSWGLSIYRYAYRNGNFAVDAGLPNIGASYQDQLVAYKYDADVGSLQVSINGTDWFTIASPGQINPNDGFYIIGGRKYASSGEAYSDQLNLGHAVFAHAVPAGYSSLVDAMAFDTSKPYFVTTSDLNHIDLSLVEAFVSLSITRNEPVNTSIKMLVSFDGRQTWQKVGGGGFVAHPGGLDDLQNGNTIAEMITAFTGLPRPDGAVSLDFAFDLATTDAGATPSIDQVTVVYLEQGIYQTASVGVDYLASVTSESATRIKKLSAGPSNIKVNIVGV